MDITIEALKHQNQDKLLEYYSKTLNKKYSHYPFVKSINAKVAKVDGKSEVNLLVHLEKRGKIFSSGLHDNEHTALAKAISKINVQIEKYKEKHYN